MKILVTGTAGFIVSFVAMRLLARGDVVISIDNHNDYYDPALKEARVVRFINNPAYTHLRIDSANTKAIMVAFEKYKPERVISLAAQAGGSYSIENPMAYIQSNVVSFTQYIGSMPPSSC